MFLVDLSVVLISVNSSGALNRTHASPPIQRWTSAQHFCSNCVRFFTAGVRHELILSLYLSIEENHHMFETLKVSACVSACSAVRWILHSIHYAVCTASSLELKQQNKATARSRLWFPGNASTDIIYSLNAMKIASDKSICQMHECKSSYRCFKIIHNNDKYMSPLWWFWFLCSFINSSIKLQNIN